MLNGCSAASKATATSRSAASPASSTRGPAISPSSRMPKYLSHLDSTQASAVIVGIDVPAVARGPALLRSEHPYLAFAQAVGLFVQAAPPARGIDPTSSIAPDATIGADVSIGPFVTIGAGACHRRAHRHLSQRRHRPRRPDRRRLRRFTRRSRFASASSIGNRVVLQDGAVIGSDGFGFVNQADGTHLKIPQHGAVVIEDDVEIGANTTIDRPAVGETRIGAGTKIDNLVQIGHGVTVGRRVLFRRAGRHRRQHASSKTTWCWPARSASPVTCASARAWSPRAQTGIPNSVEPARFVSGYPAISNRDWLKSSAVYRRLPALKKTRGGARAADRGARGEARDMPDSVGSVIRRALAGAVPRPRSGDSRRSPSSRCRIRRQQAEFMSRYDFHLSAAGLGSDDQRASRGTRTGAATSTSSTTSTAGCRFWPTTRRCSATSSGRSIRTRATTRSRFGLGPSRQDRARRRLSPRLAASERSAEASGGRHERARGARAAPIRRRRAPRIDVRADVGRLIAARVRGLHLDRRPRRHRAPTA